MIDLAALAGLRAVATHGSVVAAANATGFTPSAVSQQIKRLERQTGVPLLERVGRGVMLTSHGRHLVAAGERVLADLEQLEAELQQRAERRAGRLRLVAFSTAMRGLVAPVARQLLDAHPDLRPDPDEREPWDVVDLVAAGQVELGIVHRWGGVPFAVPDHVAPLASPTTSPTWSCRATTHWRPARRSPRATSSTSTGSPLPKAPSAASGCTGCTTAPAARRASRTCR